MIVVTGRQRTLTWSGELTGSARLGYDLNLTVYSRSGQMSAAACGCGVSVESSVGALTGTVTVNAGNGIVSDTDSVAFAADDPAVSMAGTWSISADVEECYEASAVDASLTDADGYPTFGGGALKDGPVGRRIRFFERLRVGGTVTATITAGSLTATASSTITSGDVRAAGYELAMEVAAECQNQVETFSVSGGSVAGGWGASAYSESETVGGGTATATIGAASDVVTASLALNAPIGSDPFAVIVANGEVAASATRMSGYTVSGRALRWTDAYDGELTAHVKTTATTGVDVASDTSGQWSGYDVTHRSWSASSTLQGIAQTGESGGTPATSCRVHLTSASLAARGEDDRDWRLLIAGKPYKVLTVDHSATASVPGNGEGYRYLRVQHKSVGASNQSWTLSIGTKSWNLQTAGDDVTVTTDLDLCAPDNASAATDAKSSRYPLDAPGGNPVDSAYWGVSQVTAPVYSKPPEVQVVGVNLQRQSASARLSWAPALTPWLPAWTSPTDATYHKPHGWSEVDGRVADIPSAFFVDVSGPGDYYSHQTIDQTRSRLDGFGGWSASLFGSWPDAFHNADRDSWWIGGTGHVWRGYPSGAWHSEIDRPVSGPTDVWGCGLWDEVEGYPGIGDAWERADYPSGTEPTRLPVRFSKILRGHAWGLLLRSGGGVGELRRTSDDALRGSETADSRGFYHTRAPYGQGEVAHRVQVQGEPTPNVALTVHNRMRHRAVIRAVTGGEGWHVATDGERNAAVTPDPDGFRLWVWDHRSLDLERVCDLGYQVADCQVAALPHFGWAVFALHAGTISRYETRDSGQSWSAAVTVGSATGVACAVDRDTGIEYVAGYVGDRWKLWRKLPGASSFGSPIADIAVVAAGRGGLECVPVGGGRLVFVCDDGSTVRRYLSTDRGASWST